MLYQMGIWLKSHALALSLLNTNAQVGMRASGALLSSFVLSLIGGSWFIEQSKRFFRAKSRQYTPETHRAKDNTPTMGGLFIVATSIMSMLLWGDVREPRLWIMVICLIGFGGIGFLDDWRKIKARHGISARLKFVLQCLVALLAVGWWLWIGGTTKVMVPCFSFFYVDLGWVFMLWALLVIVGTSNAVNLTDGLDGLAVGSLLPNFALFAIMSYWVGYAYNTDYCAIYCTITGAGVSAGVGDGIKELAVVGASLCGASLGFLWYNTYPAQIFMGDVGSLSLGAGIGLMALMVKRELLLVLSGGIFVGETLSVMVQVLSYKLRGKRFFKMAPLHHHFELIGCPETRITTRFSIVSIMLCIGALIICMFC